MLEHVALNQTGFKIPGVAPDARGVLIGKQGAALLPSLDRLVAFFRLLSEESSLDDILPSLKIVLLRTRVLSREYLVLLPAQSSYLLDRCARVAALCGGVLCTGSGKHYVKYRDQKAPLGYDADALYMEMEPGPADYVLYLEAFTSAYAREKELPLLQLLQELSLRQLPGGARRDITEIAEREERELLWLLVRKGIAKRVLSYLWRNRVKAAATQLDAAPGLLPGPAAYLVRVPDLPRRMLDLLFAVPGIEVFLPAAENAVVELGFRHPIRLTSCGSVFQKDRFYLFCGRRDTCEVLPGPLPLLPIEGLIDTGAAVAVARTVERTTREPRAPEQVPLRLCRSATPRHRAVQHATLVPWPRLRWFRRLIYVLPPTLLQDYRVALIEEGLLVTSTRGIEVLPLGQPLQELAPSILAPLGMDLLPRVGAQVLTEHLGGVAGRCLLLLPGDGAESEIRALSIPHGAFEPLGRRALAPLPISEREAVLEQCPAAPPGPTLVNDPVGWLPLWGFSDEGPG